MYGALNRALYKNNNNRFDLKKNLEDKFGRVRVRIKLTNKERLE